MSKLTVTYIKHSGFLIETANSYLLFDYWQGKLPELQYDKELYIFSSHAHHDHYTKDIFKLENKCQRVVYVLSSDEAKMFAFPYLERKARPFTMQEIFTGGIGQVSRKRIIR